MTRKSRSDLKVTVKTVKYRPDGKDSEYKGSSTVTGLRSPGKWNSTNCSSYLDSRQGGHVGCSSATSWHSDRNRSSSSLFSTSIAVWLRSCSLDITVNFMRPCSKRTAIPFSSQIPLLDLIYLRWIWIWRADSLWIFLFLSRRKHESSIISEINWFRSKEKWRENRADFQIKERKCVHSWSIIGQ